MIDDGDLLWWRQSEKNGTEIAPSSSSNAFLGERARREWGVCLISRKLSRFWRVTESAVKDFSPQENRPCNIYISQNIKSASMR